MRNGDPFEDWLRQREYIRNLAAQKRTNVLYARSRRATRSGDVGQAEYGDLRDMVSVQDEHRQVVEAGGPGTTYLQEALLELIATTAERRSLPFWLDLITYKRPRDSFAKRRRLFVFSAIAFLAVERDAAEAYDALLKLTAHALPEIRETAVEYLGKAYLLTDQELPPAVITRLSEVASADHAYGPRFWARRWLREMDEPVPFDNPDGAYVFKVRLKWLKEFHCTIAVRSDQRLDDLHDAIQSAFEWDDPHLYAFFMLGEVHDRRYMIAGPYLDDVPAHVVDIQPYTEPGPYPRLVARKGTPPPQYPWIEDEDWDDE